MNIEEIDKWLDNEYGVSYTKLEELHDFVVDRDIEHQEQKDKIINDLLKRISNLEFEVEDKQREIERLNQYIDFYKDLDEKQNKELQNLKQANEEHQKLNGELRVENERLNNIINELDGYLDLKRKSYIEGFKWSGLEIIDQTKDFLQELKGSESNE